MTKIENPSEAIEEKAEEAKKIAKAKLDELKEKANPASRLSALINDFFKDFSSLSTSERIKRIAEIAFVATIGRFIGKRTEGKKQEAKAENKSEETEEEEDETEEESGEERSEKADEDYIDPSLVGEVPQGGKAVYRKSIDMKKVVEDHRHNAKLLEVTPQKVTRLNEVVEHYKTHKARYEKVAKLTGIPGMLICALHYREGFKFDRYLHNGERLGSPTTYVPAGILFKEGEWEKAAAHALGGNVVDANGKPSLKKFRSLRDEVGLSAGSKDIAAMMAFSERYNGMGYRYKGIRSCYVYAGTNLNQPGRYVADHKFDPKSVDKRLGTAAIIMGIQSMESGTPLRIAKTKNQPIA